MGCSACFHHVQYDLTVLCIFDVYHIKDPHSLVILFYSVQ